MPAQVFGRHVAHDPVKGVYDVGFSTSVAADDGRYPQSDDGESPEDGEDFLVRPYTVTGGRTKPHYHLEIEAMIAAAYYEAGDLSQLSPECRAEPLLTTTLLIGSIRCRSGC